MRVLLCLLVIGAVFASNSETQHIAAIVQKVTKTVSDAYATQDYSQLNSLCAGGSISSYLNSLLPGIPPLLQMQFSTIFAGLGPCLDPMCSIVTSSCWADLQTNLPTNNCVPGLTNLPAVLQTACANGCFSQLDAVVASSAQCLTNWAATSSGGLGGLFTLNVNLTPAAASSSLLCMQNPGDALFCVTKLSSAATLLANAADITDPANCPYFASLGCCATGLQALLDVFNGTVGTGCASNVAPFTSAQYSQALTACGLSGVASCPLIGDLAKMGVVHWVIDHIDFTAWNALTAQEKLDFLAALRADFAASTGLTLPVISVGSIIAAASGIDVKFIIRAISDTLTNTDYAAYLAYISGSTTPTFTSTTAFSGGHSGLTTGTVQLNEGASSSSLETQSGAGGSSSGAFAVVFSSALVVFAVALAFLFA